MKYLKSFAITLGIVGLMGLFLVFFPYSLMVALFCFVWAIVHFESFIR